MPWDNHLYFFIFNPEYPDMACATLRYQTFSWFVIGNELFITSLLLWLKVDE